jgi:CDP-6-deoxy-D-xylo-4-hexulose-3-dehydrase
MSTIEGGFVTTNDYQIYTYLLSIRSHGWTRDYSTEEGFYKDFNFIHDGFNVRNTEVGAFLGLRQLDNLDEVLKRRGYISILYNKYLYNTFWKLMIDVPLFAYPVIHPDRELIIEALREVCRTRPLLGGNMLRQPFMLHDYKSMKFADVIHDYGFYVPCHQDMTEEDVKQITDIINDFTHRT